MLGAIIAASASLSTGSATDFGVRLVGIPSAPARGAEAAVQAVLSGKGNLSAARAIGAQWGRVTSTVRSPEHNRRVGGVANSYHLSGRAIDIARNAGVGHGAIEAAYRSAGYRLVESLDEGDHSHFAFSFGGGRPSSLTPLRKDEAAATQFKIVYAPR